MILKIVDFFKPIWYWFFTGLLLLIFFVSKGHSFSQVFYFITFLLPIVIGTSYYVNDRLIPKFLLRKKNGLFILYSIYTIIISLYLQYLIIFLALFVFTSYQLGNQSLLTINISNLSLILYLMVLTKVIIEVIQKLNQKETIIKSLEKKKGTTSEPFINKLIIRYNRVNHSINLSEIIYIESLSDYIKIVTENDEIVTKEKISKIIERLPPYFKRTHRSFIVNSQKISSYNKELITLGNYQMPISRTYKTDVITYLD
jgi:two-component system response regulator LytT